MNSINELIKPSHLLLHSHILTTLDLHLRLVFLPYLPFKIIDHYSFTIESTVIYPNPQTILHIPLRFILFYRFYCPFWVSVLPHPKIAVIRQFMFDP